MKTDPLRIQSELWDELTEINEDSLDLLVSYFTPCSFDFNRVEDILVWLEKLNRKITCEVKLIPLRKIEKWYFDEHFNLRHESGKFFSIEGIKVRTNTGIVQEWSQPIINQPEIGILGIICQKKNGVLNFLMQAKIEPGNVNKVQLSPTVQATKSNYTQVHRGLRPQFLDYFIDIERIKIIADQLQSEQGARFLKKRNRNVIVEIDPEEEIPVTEEFRWLTLGQLKRLMKIDNIINMDARTVLSCLLLPKFKGVFSEKLKEKNIVDEPVELGLFDSALCDNKNKFTIEKIISWFTDLKMNTMLEVTKCSLNDLDEWKISKYDISHINKKYFKVIGVNINIDNREVTRWCQPLIKQCEEGIIGFIIKNINGVYHILVQAKMEAGNFDLMEMAPTVQCVTGSYKKPEYDVPYLEYFLRRGKGKIIYDTHQSEEGGRFYKEQNRYIVLEVGSEFPVEVKKKYIWMTLSQAKEFIKFNNYFNIEARSLIACFSPI